MHDLAIIDSGPSTPRLYERMQAAIAECHSIDDCKTIADHAVAIAAYHKQIKDDASVRKFIQIKLRAWRRIGELLSTVDRSDCGDNVAAQIRKIMSAFKGNEAVEELSDSAIREALRLAALPADFFERNVADHRNCHTLCFAYERLQQEKWEASPAGQKELKRREKERQERAAAEAQYRAEKETRAAQEAAAQEAAQRTMLALHAAHQEAISEVGFTLDRRDREDMREVVFMIKGAVHEALRQAAFDNRMTMQAVLRAGLAMWFIAHGYDVPLSELDLRPKKAAGR